LDVGIIIFYFKNSSHQIFQRYMAENHRNQYHFTNYFKEYEVIIMNNADSIGVISYFKITQL